MADKSYTIDRRTGRPRAKPQTQKEKKQAKLARSALPPIYATTPTLPPTAEVPASPTDVEMSIADADADAAAAAGAAAPTAAAGPSVTGAAAPSPIAQTLPEPYNFHRDEPTYGTFPNEPLNFEIPQAKKRGPVSDFTAAACQCLMSGVEWTRTRQRICGDAATMGLGSHTEAETSAGWIVSALQRAGTRRGRLALCRVLS